MENDTDFCIDEPFLSQPYLSQLPILQTDNDTD
jgi:hypothetical protein